MVTTCIALWRVSIHPLQEIRHIELYAAWSGNYLSLAVGIAPRPRLIALIMTCWLIVLFSVCRLKLIRCRGLYINCLGNVLSQLTLNCIYSIVGAVHFTIYG